MFSTESAYDVPSQNQRSTDIQRRRTSMKNSRTFSAPCTPSALLRVYRMTVSLSEDVKLVKAFLAEVSFRDAAKSEMSAETWSAGNLQESKDFSL